MSTQLVDESAEARSKKGGRLRHIGNPLVYQNNLVDTRQTQIERWMIRLKLSRKYLPFRFARVILLFALTRDPSEEKISYLTIEGNCLRQTTYIQPKLL